MKHKSRAFDILAGLHEEGGAAREWVREMIGLPCFFLGRFVESKGRLSQAPNRWPTLFEQPVPDAVYIWPGFALLHIKQEGAGIVGRALVFTRRTTYIFPRQCRFKRDPGGVEFERWPLGGDTSKFSKDDVGFIPDLYLAAIDARDTKVEAAPPGSNFDRFACLVPEQIAAMA